jgi:hypothetical protein
MKGTQVSERGTLALSGVSSETLYFCYIFFYCEIMRVDIFMIAPLTKKTDSKNLNKFSKMIQFISSRVL